MIEIHHFTKLYGSLAAVQDLTLQIPSNTVCGFIGPNGAGKSTTIRYLATLIPATSGDATIAGHSVNNDPFAVRRVIGYMPEDFGVYDGMRVWEYVDFFGAAYKIPAVERRRAVDDVLELVDLTHKRDTMVQALSRGMKQRLCLAKSLVHNPQVLILDEPASGLDPRARIEMKALLRELRKMGKTVLISSHILAELADLCDSVAILERGRLLASGNLVEIGRRLREHRRFELTLTEHSPHLDRMLGASPHVLNFEQLDGHYTVNFAGDNEALLELNRRLFSSGLPILTIRELEVDLEEMFLKITTGAVQ